MVSVILSILFLTAGIYCVASIANAWQRRKLEESEPLVSLDTTEMEACTPHAWRDLILLKPEQLAEYRVAPDRFKPATYCEKCGYVPSMQMQVTKKYREIMEEQEALIRSARDKAKEIEVLSEEFLEAAMKQLNVREDEASSFRAGYSAYAQFVSVLPELVEKNRIRKVLAKLDTPAK